MSPDPQTQSMFKLCQWNILGEVKVHKQKKVPKPRSQKEHKPASPVTCCQITCQSPRWSQPVHKLIQSTWLWTKMKTPIAMKVGKQVKV
jgi:hypothetical protein